VFWQRKARYRNHFWRIHNFRAVFILNHITLHSNCTIVTVIAITLTRAARSVEPNRNNPSSQHNSPQSSPSCRLPSHPICSHLPVFYITVKQPLLLRHLQFPIPFSSSEALLRSLHCLLSSQRTAMVINPEIEPIPTVLRDPI